MPFANEHAARQSNPDDYARFARNHPQGWPAGVDAIFGVDKQGTSHLQSVRFKKSQWTPDRARRWLEEHHMTPGLDEAKADAPDVEYGERSAIYADGSSARFDEAATDEGEIVHRFDIAELAAPEMTKHGFMRAQGYLTRSGVFSYKRADGSTRREFRPPEAVFDPKSMASFALAPLTLGHPRDASGETVNLNPASVRQHAVGTVGTPVRVGDMARADVLVTDATAIQAVHNGQNRLSCGYDCKLVERPGMFVRADGIEEPFDVVQIGMEGNHVALVHAARAGGAAVLRADSTDAELCVDAKPGKDDPEVKPPKAEPKATGEARVKITIDGAEHDVPDAVAAQLRKLADASALAVTRADEAKREADKAAGTIAALQLEKTNATQRAQDDAKVLSRVEVAAKGAVLLGKPLAEVVRMDEAEIIREVLTKEAPSIDLKGKSADYARALFDHITANKVDTTAALNAITGGKPPEVKRADGGGGNTDADKRKKIDDARAKMINDQANAWAK